jgi:hypothetical protein
VSENNSRQFPRETSSNTGARRMKEADSPPTGGVDPNQVAAADTLIRPDREGAGRASRPVPIPATCSSVSLRRERPWSPRFLFERRSCGVARRINRFTSAFGRVEPCTDERGSQAFTPHGAGSSNHHHHAGTNGGNYCRPNACRVDDPECGNGDRTERRRHTPVHRRSVGSWTRRPLRSSLDRPPAASGVGAGHMPGRRPGTRCPGGR